jgi:hypothetical protein
MTRLTRGSALLTLTLAAAIASPLRAQSPSGNTMSATGRDFDAQRVQKLGAMNADLLCEHLFDSADQASMVIELSRVAGPGILLGKFSQAAGLPSGDQKKTYDDLRVLARQKVWLPVAGERQVGEWLDQKYRKESLVVEPSELPRTQRARFDMAKGVMDGIVATLPADNPYTFTLTVTQADESNASVSPGGFVYVTTGMLQDKTLDRDDLALRLSHEMAHLTRRHSLKEIQVKVVDTLEVTKGLGPILDFTREPARGMQTLFGTMKGTELMFQRFGQVQELEADACGAYLLVRQPGVDAKAAIKRFATTRAGTGSGKGWEASHPAPEEREIVMNAQLDPAARARVAQLRVGDAPSPAFAAGGTAANSAAQTPRSEVNQEGLSPTSAGIPPITGTSSLGSLFDKIKKSVP